MRVTNEKRAVVVEAQVACFETYQELLRLTGCGCVWDQETLEEALTSIDTAREALNKAKRVLCEVHWALECDFSDGITDLEAELEELERKDE